MSENAPATESVEIPGELRLSNPVPPPITARLPIVSWPDEVKNGWFGLLAFLLGALFALSFVAILSGAHDLRMSFQHGFLLLVVLPCSLFFGVSFMGVALTCFWDAVRNDPVLEITADGLHDRRSGLSVSWSSVRCARILYNRGGMGGVDLQLRGPMTNWQNPFRIGVLFHRYRPRPDHVIVSVAFLDVGAHVVAYAILTLTQWNGGEAISKTPGSFDMGLKVIPRRAPTMINQPASFL